MLWIATVVFVAFCIICISRAKYDKKVASNKLFYTIFGIGVFVIPTVGGMYIGYKNFGHAESFLLASTLRDLMIVNIISALYVMIIGIIFNLDSMKNNIVKIIVTFIAFPFAMFMSSVGMCLSNLGNVGNFFAIGMLICISIIFLIMNKEISNKKIGSILYSVAVMCVTISLIFSVDLFFQDKYVASMSEIYDVENILKDDLDSIVGEGKWNITSLRKGEITNSLLTKWNLEGAAMDSLFKNDKTPVKFLTLNYLEPRTNIVCKYEMFIRTKDDIEFIPLHMLIEKAEEILPEYIRLRVKKQATKVEFMAILNKVKSLNLTLDNFSLSEFLDIVSDNMYVKYTNVMPDEVRKIVGDKIEIRQ